MEKAASFHAYQVEALATAGVDILFAATIPSLSEATGMSAAMAASGLPYAISFVLDSKGRILDGTPVRNAIDTIDENAVPRPLFYMANCCHPTFYASAMRGLLRQDAALLQRIIGLQANTSAKDAAERDNLSHLDPEDPDRFARSMLGLHRDFGTRIFGGCCGTDDRHMAAIAAQCRQLEVRRGGRRKSHEKTSYHVS
jgi:homocysteine S-methyltransferase